MHARPVTGKKTSALQDAEVVLDLTSLKKMKRKTTHFSLVHRSFFVIID